MKAASAAAAALALAAPAEAQDRPSVAPKNMQAIAPALADYTDYLLFGGVWRGPELSPRDRSIVTLSVLIATGRPRRWRATWGAASITTSSPPRSPAW